MRNGDGILAECVRPIRGVFKNRHRLTAINAYERGSLIEIIQSRIYTVVVHRDVKVKFDSYKKKWRTSVINGIRTKVTAFSNCSDGIFNRFVCPPQ